MSFALLTPDGCQLPGSYVQVIDPGCEVPEEAAEVHGLTTEIVREFGTPIDEAMPELLVRLAAVSRLGWPLVIYNARYDWTLLAAEVRRLFEAGRFRVARPPEFVLIDPLVLDCHLDRFRKGGRKLEAVARHYGVWRDGAHDALVDCVMAAGVARAIATRFEEVQRLELGDSIMAYQRGAHRAWVEQINAYKQRKAAERGEALAADELIPAEEWPGV